MKSHTVRLAQTRILLATSTVAIALAICSPQLAMAGKGEHSQGQRGVLPVNARFAGKTYGEWSAIWWQWVLSIPASSNPLINPTPEFASLNRDAQVWLLSGTLGNFVELNLTIPSGTAVFMPVHNWIFGATVFDCDPSNPGVPCDVETLRDLAATAASAVDSMEVTLDGEPVGNLDQYRSIP